MKVTANMSKEVYEYYRPYVTDWSELVNKLLELYDISNLPPLNSGPRYTARTVDVYNETYLAMYDALGAKNKAVSLARLLEFGKNIDILSTGLLDNIGTISKEEGTINHLKKEYLKIYKSMLSLLAEDYSPEFEKVVINYKTFLETIFDKGELSKC